MVVLASRRNRSKLATDGDPVEKCALLRGVIELHDMLAIYLCCTSQSFAVLYAARSIENKNATSDEGTGLT